MVAIVVNFEIVSKTLRNDVVEIEANELPNAQGQFRTSVMRLRFTPQPPPAGQSTQEYNRALLLALGETITLTSTP